MKYVRKKVLITHVCSISASDRIRSHQTHWPKPRLPFSARAANPPHRPPNIACSTRQHLQRRLRWAAKHPRSVLPSIHRELWYQRPALMLLLRLLLLLQQPRLRLRQSRMEVQRRTRTARRSTIGRADAPASGMWPSANDRAMRRCGCALWPFRCVAAVCAFGSGESIIQQQNASLTYIFHRNTGKAKFGSSVSDGFTII